MKIELITIGREILDGRIIDTNKAYIGRKLQEIGHTLANVQTVSDVAEDIHYCFQIAQDRSDLVIVTGGLGPTSDDISAETFANFAQVSFEESPEARADLEACFQLLGRKLTEAQLKQALLPKGAKIVKNKNGTAPGFHFELHKTLWFFFPGVPKEMKTMLEESVLNRFHAQKNRRNFVCSTIFSSEGQMQDRLKDFQSRCPDRFEFSFHTHFPFNFITLYEQITSDSSDDIWQNKCQELHKLLEDVCFHTGDSEANFLQLFSNKLLSEDLKLGTVESCTGGLIANLITDLPGSSRLLMESWITYANEAKIQLGVPSELLEKHGAVSEECAQEMLIGGIEKLREIFPEQDLACLATTGIAGPGGATPDKAVGTCFLGYALYCAKSNETILSVEKAPLYKNFPRKKYKELFAYYALHKLYKALA